MRAYRNLYPCHCEEDIDQLAGEMFDKVDINGNGQIEFSEWCTVTMNQAEMLNEANM